MKPTLGPLDETCGFLTQNAKSSSIPCPQQQYLLFRGSELPTAAEFVVAKGPLTQAEPRHQYRGPGQAGFRDGWIVTGACVASLGPMVLAGHEPPVGHLNQTSTTRGHPPKYDRRIG